jgi:hypothetical protein
MSLFDSIGRRYGNGGAPASVLTEAVERLKVQEAVAGLRWMADSDA